MLLATAHTFFAARVMRFARATFNSAACARCTLFLRVACAFVM